MSEYYKVGLNNVGSYQVSGLPYVTGSIEVTNSAVEVDFPFVTSEVFVVNRDNNSSVRVGYSARGVNAAGEASNYFVLEANTTSPVMKVKATSVFLRTSGSGETATVDVHASLTKIGIREIDRNWSGSVGIG